jgi:hypothetical protein
MSEPILCAICAKPVPLEEGKTDGDGKAVHETCYAAMLSTKLPSHIAISPMTLACPRCNAEPAKVCEVLPNGQQVVHLERVRLAAAIDVAATNT